MNDLERITEWMPAWDKTSTDPKKNYGIHGVECRWVVKGPLGAVQFVLYTNWQLPHITKRHIKRQLNVRDHISLEVMFLPLPADVGYHSPKPMYTDHTARENCPYLDGKPCYYDGSGIRAEGVFDILLEKGGEAVWDYLETEYRTLFEEEERKINAIA